MPSKHFQKFDNCTVGDIAESLHVTRRTVNDWLMEGCPRNQDQSMSIFDVHKWIVNKKVEKHKKNKDKSPYDEKLETDIEYKRAQIAKIQNKFIEREVMDRVLASRAQSLSNFLSTAAIKNSIHYVGKSLEEMQTIRFAESEECMRVYVGANDPS